MTTIKTHDNKLHFYPKCTANEVIVYLTNKGMIKVDNPTNNREFKVIN